MYCCILIQDFLSFETSVCVCVCVCIYIYIYTHILHIYIYIHICDMNLVFRHDCVSELRLYVRS